MYTRDHSFFTAGSPSATTSSAWFVGDFQSLTVQFGSASTVTLQGSNADGFTAAIPDGTWSNLSVIAAAGIQKVETGFRWMRAYRSQSTNTVTAYGQSRN